MNWPVSGPVITIRRAAEPQEALMSHWKALLTEDSGGLVQVVCERRRRAQRSGERGVSSVEFAVVLPLFMMLFFVVLGLTVMMFSTLFAATGVPVEVRAAATHVGSPQILSALDTTAPGAGDLTIGTAPGCERAVYGQLSSDLPFLVPMLDAMRVGLRLHGGSVMRNWQFWAGPPDDGCN
jgi:hypothetical protein